MSKEAQKLALEMQQDFFKEEENEEENFEIEDMNETKMDSRI